MEAQPLRGGKSITKGALAMEIAEKLEERQVRAAACISGLGSHCSVI